MPLNTCTPFWVAPRTLPAVVSTIGSDIASSVMIMGVGVARGGVGAQDWRGTFRPFPPRLKRKRSQFYEFVRRRPPARGLEARTVDKRWTSCPNGRLI